MPKTIPLSRGLQTVVDDEDYACFGHFKWHATPSGYAAKAGSKGAKIYLARAIMNASEHEHVHHVSGDKLDNQKSNLQILTASVHLQLHNRRKTPKPGSYKGVSYKPARGTWKASIRLKNAATHLGYYTSAEAAAKAYDAAAFEAWGPEAYLNFPEASVDVQIFEQRLRRPIVRHGTQHMYLKYGCRCAECRASNAKFHREQRKGRRERANADLHL